MKARRLALLTLAAGAAGGLVWWRRRASRTPEPPVQLGLADGTARALGPKDPATAELRALAAGVRASFTGGT